jgi:hypothetical protein
VARVRSPPRSRKLFSLPGVDTLRQHHLIWTYSIVCQDMMVPKPGNLQNPKIEELYLMLNRYRAQIVCPNFIKYFSSWLRISSQQFLLDDYGLIIRKYNELNHRDVFYRKGNQFWKKIFPRAQKRRARDRRSNDASETEGKYFFKYRPNLTV